MGATVLTLTNARVSHGTEWDKSCLYLQQPAALSVPGWEKVNPQMESEARGAELLRGCTVHLEGRFSFEIVDTPLKGFHGSHSLISTPGFLE